MGSAASIEEYVEHTINDKCHELCQVNQNEPNSAENNYKKDIFASTFTSSFKLTNSKLDSQSGFQEIPENMADSISKEENEEQLHISKYLASACTSLLYS